MLDLELDQLIEFLDPSEAEFAIKDRRKEHKANAIALINQHPELLGMQSEHNNNFTPLIAALCTDSHRWSMAMLTMLMQEPCNINARATCGRSALHYLAYDNHYEFIIKILTSSAHKADIDAATFEDNKTPTYFAALKGSANALKVLTILGKADVTIANSLGQSPLHVACLFGQTKGGVPNPDLTPMLALEYETCIEVLLANGALVNAKDHKGKSPADYLASAMLPAELEDIKIRVLKTLQSYGVNLNAKAADGWQPAEVAAFHNNVTFSKTLHQARVPSLVQLCLQKIYKENKASDIQIDELTKKASQLKIAMTH